MNKLKLNSNIINIICNYLTINKNEIKIKKKTVMVNLLLNTVGISIFLNAIYFQYIKNFKIIHYKHGRSGVWTLERIKL